VRPFKCWFITFAQHTCLRLKYAWNPLSEFILCGERLEWRRSSRKDVASHHHSPFFSGKPCVCSWWEFTQVNYTERTISPSLQSRVGSFLHLISSDSHALRYLAIKKCLLVQISISFQCLYPHIMNSIYLINEFSVGLSNYVMFTEGLVHAIERDILY